MEGAAAVPPLLFAGGQRGWLECGWRLVGGADEPLDPACSIVRRRPSRRLEFGLPAE